MKNELQKQINWLAEQVSILTPSGQEAYEIPESILELLKEIKSGDNGTTRSSQSFFSDEEYRIVLAALGRERKICKKLDGNGHSLCDIMDNIEKKIKRIQYPQKYPIVEKFGKGNRLVWYKKS